MDVRAKFGGPTVQVAVRLDKNTDNRILEAISGNRLTKAEYIRQAIDAKLESEAADVPAG